MQTAFVRSLSIHVLATLAYSSFLSALSAALLHFVYHGRPVMPDYKSSSWRFYFDFGLFQIDHRLMLGIFVVDFVLLPILFGYYLARHDHGAKFKGIGAFLGFGFLLALGVIINLWVGFVYGMTGFNSSDPF